jgi:hypothetical protein
MALVDILDNELRHLDDSNAAAQSDVNFMLFGDGGPSLTTMVAHGSPKELITKPEGVSNKLEVSRSLIKDKAVEEGKRVEVEGVKTPFGAAHQVHPNQAITPTSSTSPSHPCISTTPWTPYMAQGESTQPRKDKDPPPRSQTRTQIELKGGHLQPLQHLAKFWASFANVSIKPTSKDHLARDRLTHGPCTTPTSRPTCQLPIQAKKWLAH